MVVMVEWRFGENGASAEWIVVVMARLIMARW
jgi:hypothetical protein